MNTADMLMERSAVISNCGRYRYRLTRRWGDGYALPWIMLNPSTADGTEDDPTIRKCIGFATRLGYPAIEVFNLYAWRATKPRDLPLDTGDPIGPDTDQIMMDVFRDLRLDERGIVICAWGANARLHRRAQAIRTGLALAGVRLRALRLLADGTPEHPLMLPYSCRPVPLGAA